MRGNRFLKFLDRYLGIPIVWFLGLFKEKERFPGVLERIAILKTAAIGDTVLLSAIIKDVFTFVPDAKVVLFVGSSNYEIAKLIAKQHVRLKVVKLTLKNPIEDIKIIRSLGKFDVFLDFDTWPRINSIYSFFANSSFKIGFETSGQCRHYVYDEIVKHDKSVHEISNYKNLLRVLGINGSNYPEILVPSVEKERDLVVVHMFPGGTKSYLKEWPEENWVEVINYLTKIGYRVVLTGAKPDKKKALMVYERCRRKNLVKVVAGELSLKEVALLLKKSVLVLSVNTGIMHLASALGCNLVALHGPTSVKRWGPLNPNSISIQSPLPCSPCLNLGFEYGCDENKCMRAISVETVVNAVKKFLE